MSVFHVESQDHSSLVTVTCGAQEDFPDCRKIGIDC